MIMNIIYANSHYQVLPPGFLKSSNNDWIMSKLTLSSAATSVPKIIDNRQILFNKIYSNEHHLMLLPEIQNSTSNEQILCTSVLFKLIPLVAVTWGPKIYSFNWLA